MEKQILTEEERKKKMINNIKHNYCQVEKSIVEQLYMKHDLHGVSIGSERENIWGQLFEMVLPKKFVMAHSVFIIDSGGNVSHEVDLAILDETYTPYIFRYGELKFIPIEAVAAVVECKSKTLPAASLQTWSDSIEQLQTSDQSIARMAMTIAIGAVPTQKSTRPIRILCALKKEVKEEIVQNFDFILLAVKNENELAHIEIQARNDAKNLLDWFEKLNFHGIKNTYNFKDARNGEEIKKALQNKKLTDYQVTDKDKQGNIVTISLLTFNFQLNQLLMLINNPMLFPHQAYVDMFNRETEIPKGVVADNGK